VSNPYLSQVERGLRRPSADILAQIAHGLSISVESLLAKAGILESADSPPVVSAIRGDAVLTERQKSALIDIYAAFRKEAESAVTLTAGSVVPAEPNLPAVGRGEPMPIFAGRPANTEAPAVTPEDRAVGPEDPAVNPEDPAASADDPAAKAEDPSSPTD
jgi:transcriptional regulator with XRE-family HTH domain